MPPLPHASRCACCLTLCMGPLSYLDSCLSCQGRLLLQGCVLCMVTALHNREATSSVPARWMHLLRQGYGTQQMASMLSMAAAQHAVLS